MKTLELRIEPQPYGYIVIGQAYDNGKPKYEDSAGTVACNMPTMQQAINARQMLIERHNKCQPLTRKAFAAK